MSRSAKIGAGAPAGVALLATALTDYDEKAGLANTATLGLGRRPGGGPWGRRPARGRAADRHQPAPTTTSPRRGRAGASDALRRLATPRRCVTQLELLRDEIEETEEAANLRGGGIRGLGLERRHSPSWGRCRTSTTASWTEQKEREPRRPRPRSTSTQSGLASATLISAGSSTPWTDAGADGDATASPGRCAVLNGWFDKRAAVRGYKDAIDDLRRVPEGRVHP